MTALGGVGCLRFSRRRRRCRRCALVSQQPATGGTSAAPRGNPRAGRLWGHLSRALRYRRPPFRGPPSARADGRAPPQGRPHRGPPAALAGANTRRKRDSPSRAQAPERQPSELCQLRLGVACCGSRNLRRACASQAWRRQRPRRGGAREGRRRGRRAYRARGQHRRDHFLAGAGFLGVGRASVPVFFGFAPDRGAAGFLTFTQQSARPER